MTISACSTERGSVILSFCCNVDKKEACFEVRTHIMGKKYEKVEYTDFSAAVDAYNSGVAELNALEG